MFLGAMDSRAQIDSCSQASSGRTQCRTLAEAELLWLEGVFPIQQPGSLWTNLQLLMTRYRHIQWEILVKECLIPFQYERYKFSFLNFNIFEINIVLFTENYSYQIQPDLTLFKKT